ncbi:MAG TPA: chain length-determining protein [Gammaproteobacteria bacterium]|nr:chain length-determining protein [Gammaproteobacteria bacterium]
MQETFQQLMKYIHGMWQYRWYAMAFAWFLVLVGWGVVMLKPDRYESTARINVDTDSLLTPLLKGLAVQTDVRRRLELMSRTILSRPNMERLVELADLPVDMTDQKEKERFLNELAEDIVVKGDKSRVNLFSISYTNEDPKVAKRVVESLLEIFIDSTLGEKRKDTKQAQRFLDEQIGEYEQRLTDAENRLLEFRRKYSGYLPGQEKGFFAQLQEVQTLLSKAKMDLRREQYRRDELRQQLMNARYAEGDAGTNPQTAALDERIQLLQAQLDEKSLRFTEEHPDIQALRRTISELKVQRQRELLVATPDQMESSPYFQELKLALGAADAEVAATRAIVDEYQQRVAQLQELVDTQPEIETKLQQLNRDYEVNKENYQALLERRQRAKLSEDAEETGGEFKIEIVEPPFVPLTPAGPKRLLWSSVVLLAGLGGGLGLAFLLTQIRPGIYNRRTLQEATGLPVLGTVSRVTTPQIRSIEQRERRVLLMGLATLLLCYVLVILFQVSGALTAVKVMVS